MIEGPFGAAGLLALYRLEDKLLPMGVGISDHFDVLLAPEAPPDSASILLAAILDAAGCSRCDLPELPPGARLRDAELPAGWRDRIWEGPTCPVLTLAPEPAIPKGMRRDLRQARNRATRAGGWSVERAEARTVTSLFEALATLHAARWQQRGVPGVLADPRVLGFHRAAMPGLLAAGLLRLEALRLRGHIAAATYALTVPGRICFYLAGFDPEAGFDSPGTILMGHMIEEAVGEGREEAHFLRGEEAYKYAWGGRDRHNVGRGLVRA